MPSTPLPSPLSRPTLSAHQELVHRLAQARRRHPGGRLVAGHHNVNHIVRLGWPLALSLGVRPFWTRGKFRTPLDAVEVVPRVWARESDVLSVVSRYLPRTPRCLAESEEWSLHAWIPGRALAEINPTGRVGPATMSAFAAFFAGVAGVPLDQLPPLPPDWPEEGDSDGFLNWLTDFAEHRVHRPGRRRFGALFDAVLIPRDAMPSFRRTRPPLTRRPFALLHTDVHRANVVVGRGPVRGRARLTVIDWELAMVGDVLHDLATHLVRMDYDEEDRTRMTRAWTEAMREAGHGPMTEGLADDLPVLLAFEYAQSVYADVMRAALSLPESPADAEYEEAARRVCRAMSRARQPLRLDRVPGERAAEEALRDWHAHAHATDAARRSRLAGTAGTGPIGSIGSIGPIGPIGSPAAAVHAAAG
ncbi:phosphotransferase family protein [Streptomyces tsukubensis]|uniref:Aminoglycoside phosphotransferase domain-containing protein n=1 Tax=Streptomyces tsukubensis TaxID=83656 RepID=A0A1V4A826_9ACTN|nr:phosphotransferase [Streptomyces tsukubensis]OON78836.1 hypothetical protein B1H18_15870 [Streptomyces tsukubensis]QFR94312.1 phosphotransferase [Streptomyces tsukubensis]